MRTPEKLTQKQQQLLSENYGCIIDCAVKILQYHQMPLDHLDELISWATEQLVNRMPIYDQKRGRITTFIFMVMCSNKHRFFSFLNHKIPPSKLNKIHSEPLDKIPEPYQAEQRKSSNHWDEWEEVLILCDTTPAERKIVYDYYWMGKTLQEIGNELHCTKERVRQRKNAVLTRCKWYMIRHRLSDGFTPPEYQEP